EGAASTASCTVLKSAEPSAATATFPSAAAKHNEKNNPTIGIDYIERLCPGQSENRLSNVLGMLNVDGRDAPLLRLAFGPTRLRFQCYDPIYEILPVPRDFFL